MTFLDGTLWERNDRLPAPYDDPALEWATDNDTQPAGDWPWKIAKSYDPEEIF